ncbi:MAG: M28 family peptidase [Chthoniobacterales bacterium]|nr:M28 family peptidase [Chthoniobacterales bacterium]
MRSRLLVLASPEPVLPKVRFDRLEVRLRGEARSRFSVVFTLAIVLAACSPATTAEHNGIKIWEEFSGDDALRHVQALVDLGPRPPGSEALQQARAYLAKELDGFGWGVTRQSFTDDTPEGKITFVNLIATFPAGASQAIPSFLLCSHYDTKLFANARFVGANDGGSSNGVLLEMARVLSKQPKLAARVQLVFFDGEEAYVSFTDTDGLYGSRYFAKQLAAAGKTKQFKGGILFDMVGDKSLTVTLPPDSPPTITRGIFAAAEALNVRRHFTYASGAITDDHTPLNAAGIPTIDLIDFEYPAWHTPDDTMDKISAESLDIVGSVAARYLADEALK